MNIGFFDFPIKKKKNKIYSNSGRLIIDLKNSSSQEKDEFFNLLFKAAEYGKRFFIKRIYRSYPVSIKDCEDIAIMDAYRMGYSICTQQESTMEYTVVSTENVVNKKTKKLYFKKQNEL